MHYVGGHQYYRNRSNYRITSKNYTNIYTIFPDSRISIKRHKVLIGYFLLNNIWIGQHLHPINFKLHYIIAESFRCHIYYQEEEFVTFPLCKLLGVV